MIKHLAQSIYVDRPIEGLEESTVSEVTSGESTISEVNSVHRLGLVELKVQKAQVSSGDKNSECLHECDLADDTVVADTR